MHSVEVFEFSVHSKKIQYSSRQKSSITMLATPPIKHTAKKKKKNMLAFNGDTEIIGYILLKEIGP